MSRSGPQQREWLQQLLDWESGFEAMEAMLPLASRPGSKNPLVFEKKINWVLQWANFFWLVVWLPFFVFPSIGNSHPISDELHHFSEGWPNHQPVFVFSQSTTPTSDLMDFAGCQWVDGLAFICRLKKRPVSFGDLGMNKPPLWICQFSFLLFCAVSHFFESGNLKLKIVLKASECDWHI